MTFQPRGIIPAMVTPFNADGSVDTGAIKPLVDFLVKGGIHGLFVCGSQGEAYGLTPENRMDAIKETVRAAGGRVPVYAGSGATTTREAVSLTRMAEGLGADAISAITPYFISPNQQELFEYFKAIAGSTRLPVLIYNNPDRTGVHVSAQLVKDLSAIGNIVGAKDSSGDVTLAMEYIRLTPKGFAVLSGRDTTIYATLACGGCGGISATANIVPKLVAEIYDSFVAGDRDRALQAQLRLAPVRHAFSLGTFPGIMKDMMEAVGLRVGTALPPVQPISGEKRERMLQILRTAGLEIVG